MVGRFRRSVSFPNPKPSRESNNPTQNSNHNSSISLSISPSHPSITQLLRDLHLIFNDVAVTRSSSSSSSSSSSLSTDSFDNISTTTSSSSWISDGLSRLKLIHDSLDELLQLPQNYGSLRRRSDFLEMLLEDSLRFVDAYGIFHSSLLDLKQELSSAQVAIRLRDNSRLGLYLKAQVKISKEISKLGSAVRSLKRDHREGEEEEIAMVMGQVHDVTVSVSGAVFDAVAASFLPVQKVSWVGSFKDSREKGGNYIHDHHQHQHEEYLWGLRKNNGNDEEMMRRGLLKRMREVEDWVCDLEVSGERVFRSLISTRVSLLNILTH
ncbi:hypothetical protein Dimus_023587 [Dionaea muscipula]